MDEGCKKGDGRLTQNGVRGEWTVDKRKGCFGVMVLMSCEARDVVLRPSSGFPLCLNDVIISVTCNMLIYVKED